MSVFVRAQVDMGGVGSSHEELCVSVAAQKRGTHGGLCGMLGTCVTAVDSGPCPGAACFPTTPERGLCCFMNNLQCFLCVNW